MFDREMMNSFDGIRQAVARMPGADEAARARAEAREATLTKPAGALGRLEGLAAWLSAWQGAHPPRTARIEVLVFAGNHGVTARGVSAFPADVTAQMVANFEAGGAAINQLSDWAGATLRVIALSLDAPTADFTTQPAMREAECLAAFGAGVDAVSPGLDLLCLGEMGIGNTTVAAALSYALFGGNARDWVGPGTGVDDAGLARKAQAIEAALARHHNITGDPLAVLQALGGRELAGLAGAILAARHHRVPVVLDGYVCTAAAAVLHAMNERALDHTVAGHCSAEPAHRRLLDALGLVPLLDLDMRLGEASGAALAAGIVRAAALTHNGMASFAEAGVAERPD